MHTQPTNSDRIASALRCVARNLSTHYQGKKHGGYKIYYDEEKQLRISLDTYVANIHCAWKGVTVFSQAYHGTTSIHRPGGWEALVLALAPKAKEVARQRQAAIEQERANRESARWAPV